MRKIINFDIVNMLIFKNVFCLIAQKNALFVGVIAYTDIAFLVTKKLTF